MFALLHEMYVTILTTVHSVHLSICAVYVYVLFIHFYIQLLQITLNKQKHRIHFLK